ncbi:MAG: hypothetical protein N3B13_00475 [Deltaproteobacteria bacterium]|nr:hypothetical protein [Deltaproteobacteria bacterium]
MKMYPCRVCKNIVAVEAEICPHCGAKKPANHLYDGTGIDYKSSIELFGYPLIHIAFGKDRNGHLRVAKGIIAIGQFGIGLITFAQFGIGILFGFGQFIVGITAIAQVAITLLFGIGQLATGYITIGQIVIGYYGLAQAGFAKYIWTAKYKDPEAVIFFTQLKEYLLRFLG